MTQPGSACRARTRASPNFAATPGATTTAATPAASTAAMRAILRTRGSCRMELARFRAATGSVALGSMAMACADMAAGSPTGALLSSDERTVLGPPNGLLAAVFLGSIEPLDPAPGENSSVAVRTLPLREHLREEEGRRRAHPRRARRGVRRHRHEPAVCAADGLLRRPPLDPAHRGGRLRRDLAR